MNHDRIRRFYLRICLWLLLGPAAVQAQDVARTDYFNQLPPMPRLVRQTAASAQLQVCGAASTPGFRDVAPRNGIDDARDAALLRLAVTFSPILRRNNFSGPRDIMLDSAMRPVQIDHWYAGTLVSSDSVLLGGPGHNVALPPAEDRKLLSLMERFAPGTDLPGVEAAEGRSDTVLFLDYPGSSERSWRRAYRENQEFHAYMHPFVLADSGSAGVRYSLVLQYWFFYPFNDGANNHEGDWEQLNVVLTTRAREQAPDVQSAQLEEAEVQAILAGTLPPDSLSIASVEYYFHETYLVLDYLAARRGQANSGWHLWTNPELINRTIRQRLADPRLATHPIGYIGGNNRGPDELTAVIPRFQAGYNRNGHGTYPLPGTWQAVGPLGSTETLSGELVPKFSSEDSLRLADDHMITFGSNDLTVIPDWECVWPAMKEDATLRAAWAWLVLPLRWGFPASRSPAGGAIKHVDLGNIAPEGPAYHSTWNRPGSRSGYRLYDPLVLRVALVPTTPWARVRSGWGILNVPVGLLGLMPGWNIATEQVLPWVSDKLNIFGAPPAVTYYPGKPTQRFLSTGFGLVHSSGGETFALLMAHEFARLRGSDSILLQGAPDAAAAFGQRAWLNVFYGRTLAIENTMTWNTRQLTLLRIADSIPDLAGTLEWRELTGGLRLNLLSKSDDALQFYGRAGWGYTWYELRDVLAGTTPLGPSRLDGGYAPTLLPSRRWWPNTWYAGVGSEFALPRTAAFGALRVGGRIEYSLAWHDVQTRQRPVRHFGWAGSSEIGMALQLSW